jgi:hypothetical protein
MPIKEILNLAFVIVLGIAVAHPMTFAHELRKIEYSILREASKTGNWGNPMDALAYKPMRRGDRKLGELSAKQHRKT